MSNISMVEEKLPPGFRFHPRDEELICDYLMKKVGSCESMLMIEVDLNKCEPWDIPETACVGGKEWYFYSQRDRKYAIGLRTNRATASGYWKATGKDRSVLRKGTLVGMRKTLVFYQGRAPKGKKTDWVMHEFRLEGPFAPPKISSPKEDWVLCRVFYKNREVAVAKGSMGISCYDHTSSSSLPALMDSYITFDQTQVTNIQDDDHQYHHHLLQQVPCFSIFSQNQINPTFPISHMGPNQLPLVPINMPLLPTFGGISDQFGINPLNNNPNLGCDKDVLKAVLNHLTKVESSSSNMKASPSFGDQASSESYLYI